MSQTSETIYTLAFSYRYETIIPAIGSLAEGMRDIPGRTGGTNRMEKYYIASCVFTAQFP